jgi:hypothetical protein
MKKIVIAISALAALSATAMAGTAFEKQTIRNKIENPHNYTFPFVRMNGQVVSGNALAIDSGSMLDVNNFGNKRWAGPGEDGNHGR